MSWFTRQTQNHDSSNDEIGLDHQLCQESSMDIENLAAVTTNAATAPTVTVSEEEMEDIRSLDLLLASH
jgi:hypothetical protein